MGAATADEEQVHARYAVFRRLTPPGGELRGSCAGWGIWQRIKMGVLGVTLLPCRAAIGLVMLSTFTAIAYVCAKVDGMLLGPQGDLVAGPMHRRVLSPAARGFTRVFLFVLGLHHIRVTGREHCRPPRAEGADADARYPAPLLVSNHVSYLDILVHFAVSGYLCPGFLAKDGVRTAPFFGPIGRIIGCQFVARETNDSLGEAASVAAPSAVAAAAARSASRGSGSGAGTSNTGSTTEMAGRLRWAEGCLASAASGVRKLPSSAMANELPKPLIVFAEGTTTNGRAMLRFRTGAFVAGCRVQPVVLSYPYAHFSPSFESVPFVAHVLAFLCQFHTPCSVTFLPPMDPGDLSPRKFADAVQRKMQAVVGGDVYDLNYNDKRSYHRWLRGGPPPSSKQA